MRIAETNGGSLDYKLTITGTDARSEYDIESSDSVDYDYGRGLTYLYGTVQNDTDVYSYPATEHITYVRGKGRFDGYQPNVKITTDASPDSITDWDLLEVNGHDQNGMSYAIRPAGDIRKYSKLESDEFIYDGMAYGELDSGDEDQWEMDGNFDRIDLNPIGGKIEIDWRNKT